MFDFEIFENLKKNGLLFGLKDFKFASNSLELPFLTTF